VNNPGTRTRTCNADQQDAILAFNNPAERPIGKHSGKEENMFSKINEALRRLVVRVQDDAGQALAEYGLIIALVSVAAIGALALLAGGIVNVFGDVSAELTGAGGS
jgi:Flp pilus assembly pilin Flp